MTINIKSLFTLQFILVNNLFYQHKKQSITLHLIFMCQLRANYVIMLNDNNRPPWKNNCAIARFFIYLFIYLLLLFKAELLLTWHCILKLWLLWHDIEKKKTTVKHGNMWIWIKRNNPLLKELHFSILF